MDILEKNFFRRESYNERTTWLLRLKGRRWWWRSSVEMIVIPSVLFDAFLWCYRRVSWSSSDQENEKQNKRRIQRIRSRAIHSSFESFIHWPDIPLMRSSLWMEDLSFSSLNSRIKTSSRGFWFSLTLSLDPRFQLKLLECNVISWVRKKKKFLRLLWK